LFAVLVILLVVGVVTFGDEGSSEGLRVVNLTSDRILIYSDQGADVEENLVIEIPSGSSRDTGLCGRLALVARGPEGDLIARRPSSESCEEEWIVRGS
jgi:hypothetical protein